MIHAIADAVVVSTQSAERCASMRRLGVAPALSSSAQTLLRTLSHINRDWRQTLLVRAWRSVELSGSSTSVRSIHTFAAPCVQRLVVPWGAMAAPVSWSAALSDSGSDAEMDAEYDIDSDTSSFGLSLDSNSQLRTLGKSADTGDSAAASACRLRSVFGDQAWPAVEHLDMSFMPLICYQGFAAHIARTMPRLRTLRIGGFVPATALGDILQLVACMPLAAVEIAGSVWANADNGRRGSASSWRSSASTIAAPDATITDRNVNSADAEFGQGLPSEMVQPVYSLQLLAVTADALRSPAVFAFAMAQMPTLRALHLLESDYKVMDMLRTGRLEERHMHAVEWATSQPMVLHSQEHQQHLHRRANRPSGAYWPALQQLHIVRYYMAPREDAGLRIDAACMPALEELIVDHMEPSDDHHPAPSPADAAQVPRLRGQFDNLTRICAPMFDTRSLQTQAPCLRSLCITGSGGPLPRAMVPLQQDIDALLATDLPLKSVVIAGKVVGPLTI
ncbi:hypothetical protein GGH20_001102 [Coemansia sp. RSA 1937]|nr:hypothetical protein GGH20_001102 [Coemansia sp. RSA 1937]